MPKTSIYQVRVQEEKRPGVTGIPLLQMQGSVLQDFEFKRVAEKAHIWLSVFVATWLCQGQVLLSSSMWFAPAKAGTSPKRYHPCRSQILISPVDGLRPRNATSSFLLRNGSAKCAKITKCMPVSEPDRLIYIISVCIYIYIYKIYICFFHLCVCIHKKCIYIYTYVCVYFICI